MRVSLSVSSAGGDLGADFAALGSLAGTIASDLAQVAADYGTPAVLLAARERRGTLSMSNNKQGRRLDALPIVRAGADHAEAEIVAVPRGAWTLVEKGAAPHVIRPKRKYGKRQRAGGLPTPYGVFPLVNHPGTAGSPVWESAMAAAEPVIDGAVQAAFDESVAKVLG